MWAQVTRSRKSAAGAPAARKRLSRAELRRTPPEELAPGLLQKMSSRHTSPSPNRDGLEPQGTRSEARTRPLTCPDGARELCGVSLPHPALYLSR